MIIPIEKCKIKSSSVLPPAFLGSSILIVYVDFVWVRACGTQNLRACGTANTESTKTRPQTSLRCQVRSLFSLLICFMKTTVSSRDRLPAFHCSSILIVYVDFVWVRKCGPADLRNSEPAYTESTKIVPRPPSAARFAFFFINLLHENDRFFSGSAGFH